MPSLYTKMKWLGFVAIALGILLVGGAGLCLVTLGLIGGDDSTPSGSKSSFATSTQNPQLVPIAVEGSSSLGGLLHVHFIDVGQGDSILIQTPSGVTALIDGGNQDGLALVYLRQQGISRIDVMIATGLPTKYM